MSKAYNKASQSDSLHSACFNAGKASHKNKLHSSCSCLRRYAHKEYRMKFIVLTLINIYQKYISHRKGYKCAYGVLHGNGTCSSKIKTIVVNAKHLRDYSEISAQFVACNQAKTQLLSERKNDKKKDDNHEWCFLAECGVWGCFGFLS